MNMWLNAEKIDCPYCGESLEILIESQENQQRYYEDCQVCCQPILIEITPETEGNTSFLRCLRADEVP